ncbi:hypothetical protein LCGC14_1520120 [marine sediment metagenome]|uniref:DNA methylase N-4/N-6 domain-containing protein n=1 Tax=marine sediment metagenome TaxID=412755 RepID=A0A0F9IYU7_9ZZZZ
MLNLGGKAVPNKCKGDSFELLPELEDKSFDLVLTDPPYDLDCTQQIDLHKQFVRLSRTGVIVFSPPENPWPIAANQYLFWIKPISTKNTSKRYSRFVEMIFLYGDLKWNHDRHWSQYTNVFNDLVDNSKLHSHRKPPSLIERLVLNHSDPGDLILDPFAGSGVVADVCKATDRLSYSIDIA